MFTANKHNNNNNNNIQNMLFKMKFNFGENDKHD